MGSVSSILATAMNSVRTELPRLPRHAADSVIIHSSGCRAHFVCPLTCAKCSTHDSFV
jgi:hypothetical protein